MMLSLIPVINDTENLLSDVAFVPLDQSWLSGSRTNKFSAATGDFII